MEHLHEIAAVFYAQGTIGSIEPFGSGIVNDTFLVVAAPGAGPKNTARFLLQKINRHVFKAPGAIMQNWQRLLHHTGKVEQTSGLSPARKFMLPGFLLTIPAGQSLFQDDSGNYWRALEFVENTHSYDRVSEPRLATEAGFALGRFHRLTHDLNPAVMHDTLPGFHNTPLYLKQYDMTKSRPAPAADAAANIYCQDFINKRRHIVPVLEEAARKGLIPVRTMHGDPKISNILFDSRTDAAVSIIDFDTVKPGLIQYDIGDCLRSCCNRLGEETTDFEAVTFDLQLCEAILQGYCGEADVFLTTADYDLFFDAVRLLAFELGLRFYTDHLAGDEYFKTARKGQNLARATVQFKLTEDIEKKEPKIKDIIGRFST